MFSRINDNAPVCRLRGTVGQLSEVAVNVVGITALGFELNSHVFDSPSVDLLPVLGVNP